MCTHRTYKLCGIENFLAVNHYDLNIMQSMNACQDTEVKFIIFMKIALCLFQKLGTQMGVSLNRNAQFAVGVRGS